MVIFSDSPVHGVLLIGGCRGKLLDRFLSPVEIDTLERGGGFYILSNTYCISVIRMGLSPGKIYNKCIARAKDARHADEVIIGANSIDNGIRYLYRADVVRIFYGQDYGFKKAQDYIREWEDMDLCSSKFYHGYDLLGFDVSVVL